MKLNNLVLVLFAVYLLSSSTILSQWKYISNPINGRIIALISRNANLIAGYSGNFLAGGLLVSTNNGVNWNQIQNMNTFFSFISYNSYLFGSSNYGVYYSLDDGVTWGQTSLRTYIYSLSQNSDKLFAGTDGAVYISSDYGMNWSKSSSISGNVFSLLTSGNIVYAGASSNIDTQGGVICSSDNGNSWSLSGLQGKTIMCLATVDGYIFAGTDGSGTYRSSDYGKTWIEMNNGIPKIRSWEFTSIGVNLFVCSEEGVFLTKDFGETWSNVSLGLNGAVVLSFGISDSYLYAGTRENGIWRRALSEMTTSVRDDKSQMPNEFKLAQNYPNPFNPTTTINYSLPQSSFVAIIVYDLLGKHVATLVNENKAVGNYSFEFDASDLVSGIYFYQLQSGNFIETKKFVLLK